MPDSATSNSVANIGVCGSVWGTGGMGPNGPAAGKF